MLLYSLLCIMWITQPGAAEKHQSCTFMLNFDGASDVFQTTQIVGKAANKRLQERLEDRFLLLD